MKIVEVFLLFYTSPCNFPRHLPASSPTIAEDSPCSVPQLSFAFWKRQTRSSLQVVHSQCLASRWGHGVEVVFCIIDKCWSWTVVLHSFLLCFTVFSSIVILLCKYSQILLLLSLPGLSSLPLATDILILEALQMMSNFWIQECQGEVIERFKQRTHMVKCRPAAKESERPIGYRIKVSINH